MKFSRLRDAAEKVPNRPAAGMRLSTPPTRQRGAALLFVVLLLIVGIGLFVVNASRETARTAQTDRVVSTTLGQIRDALAAYAAAHPTRPGALPCPDDNEDGDAETLAGVSLVCPNYLGRLPWRTLGLGDLRDESGERFWYAVSDKFRDVPAELALPGPSPIAAPLNSDTTGNRTVRTGPTATVTTTEAVAVVFAPGGVLENQSRDATPALCATTGTVLPRNRCAANYLEGIGTYDNALLGGAGPFISAEPTATFNDRLVIVRASDVVPLVERRVAGDMRRVLLGYRDTAQQSILNGGCNCYPWADEDLDLAGKSDVGQNHGRIPLVPSPHPWSPQPPAPPITIKDNSGLKDLAFPALPPYFVPNEWHKLIYYAVGANATDGAGTKCVSCTKDPLLPPPVLLKGSLSLDKNIGYAVVLITPGSAGLARAKGWTGNWGDYIDDGPNRDKDDRFVTPASKSTDRDRLLTIADDVYSASCRSNAQMLVYNAPCHYKDTVTAICKKAHDNLQACTQCSGDAYTMTTDPCRNTLSPPQCQAAVTSLQACNG